MKPTLQFWQVVGDEQTYKTHIKAHTLLYVTNPKPLWLASADVCFTVLSPSSFPVCICADIYFYFLQMKEMLQYHSKEMDLFATCMEKAFSFLWISSRGSFDPENMWPAERVADWWTFFKNII